MAAPVQVAAPVRYDYIQSPSGAEILEVLPARGDERMIRLERRRGDIVRATKIALGLCRLLRHLTDDTQIVQRVRKIRMERAEAGLLQPGRLAEQLFG